MTKWDILRKFWEKELPYLRGRFGTAGVDPAEPDFSGFGFVVEGLAHFSLKLLRNTDKGSVVGQLITSIFHEGGGGFVQLEGRRANSDFIWLKNIGRRITVCGIGEVKASYEAFRNRRWQLGRQEAGLRRLVRDLEEGKAIHDFFRKRKLVVLDEFERILIVPFGESARFKNDLTKGWKLVEIEFSYNEALFIAKQIWPDFQPDTKFKPGQLTEFEKLVGKATVHLKPTLDELFIGFGEVPNRQISLLLLAVGKLPRNQEEIIWTENMIESCYWPALQRCFDKPLVIKGDLSEEETKYYDRFLYDLTNDQISLLFFINFVRHLAVEISSQVRLKNQVRYFQSFQPLNVLEIW